MHFDTRQKVTHANTKCHFQVMISLIKLENLTMPTSLTCISNLLKVATYSDIGSWSYSELCHFVLPDLSGQIFIYLHHVREQLCNWLGFG